MLLERFTNFDRNKFNVMFNRSNPSKPFDTKLVERFDVSTQSFDTKPVEGFHKGCRKF